MYKKVVVLIIIILTLFSCQENKIKEIIIKNGISSEIYLFKGIYKVYYFDKAKTKIFHFNITEKDKVEINSNLNQININKLGNVFLENENPTMPQIYTEYIIIYHNNKSQNIKINQDYKLSKNDEIKMMIDLIEKIIIRNLDKTKYPKSDIIYF